MAKRISRIEALFRWLIRDWWVVRRTCFPFDSGYGTENPARNMMLDSGLTKEEAQARCDYYNWGLPVTMRESKESEKIENYQKDLGLSDMELARQQELVFLEHVRRSGEDDDKR